MESSELSPEFAKAGGCSSESKAGFGETCLLLIRQLPAFQQESLATAVALRTQFVIPGALERKQRESQAGGQEGASVSALDSPVRSSEKRRE